jgi:hypothetical protein
MNGINGSSRESKKPNVTADLDVTTTKSAEDVGKVIGPVLNK